MLQDSNACADNLDIQNLSTAALEVRKAGRVKKIRAERPLVTIIDHRCLNREAFVHMLEATGRYRLLAVSTAAELLQKISRDQIDPDLILFNVGSKNFLAEEVCADFDLLSDNMLKAPVVVVSDSENGEEIVQALRKGIRGYVPTTLSLQVLVDALCFVQAGATYIPVDVLVDALSRSCPSAEVIPEEALDSDQLTLRQRQVFELLRKGKPNKIIAHELGMHESTVKVHVRQIMRKMRVRNRTQVAFLASKYLDVPVGNADPVECQPEGSPCSHDHSRADQGTPRSGSGEVTGAEPMTSRWPARW